MGARELLSPAVTVYPGQNSPGPVCEFHIISVYYIHNYPAQKYTFLQLPIHSPQTRGNSLEPRNFRRIFEENMHMIRIHSYLDDLNTHLHACLTYYSLSDHSYIAHQHPAPVFRRKDKMISQQRHGMPVAAQLIHVHITTCSIQRLI